LVSIQVKRSTVIDINNDGKPDSVLYRQSANTFVIKYGTGKSAVEKEINCFKEWDSNMVNMSFGTKQFASEL
jgi:hypothetical protein